MITTSDAFQAGIDAVLADNTLGRGGFVDAIQTVIAQRFNNVQGSSWVDAIAVEMNRVGSINNPTYGSMRNKIIDAPVECAALFTALTSINALPETIPAQEAIKIIELRSDRDEVAASIGILNTFKVGQPPQVFEAVNVGINQLRGFREQIRDQLRNLIGDPDG